jgi:hypothetical protein
MVVMEQQVAPQQERVPTAIIQPLTVSSLSEAVAVVATVMRTRLMTHKVGPVDHPVETVSMVIS